MQLAFILETRFLGSIQYRSCSLRHVKLQLILIVPSSRTANDMRPDYEMKSGEMHESTGSKFPNFFVALFLGTIISHTFIIMIIALSN